MTPVTIFTIVEALPEPRRGDHSPTGLLGRKGNPNRYAYKVGKVQRLIQQVVQHPNQWVLARQGASNRSSLAPTLSKYPQIKFSTRKQDDGTFDIYVRYTPNTNGTPDDVLAQALADWKRKDEVAIKRNLGLPTTAI
jgi:hypothetical protein